MPNWWPFGKKESIDPEALFREAEAELRQSLAEMQAAGTSRQALVVYIEETGAKLESGEQTPAVTASLRALDLLYEELRPQIMGNLSTGKAHEMAGRVDDAIRHYETAVSDQVATRFPYEHLRIIYNRRSHYADALRVCRAAVENPYLTAADHAHFQKWAARFEQAHNS